MANKNTHMAFRLMPIATALLAAFGNAHAQENAEVKELITPDSAISVGIGVVNHTQDANRFGQYTGMNKGSAYGLLDFDWVKRNDATGTWTILNGRDLGLDTREFSFSQQKQGDWKYKFDYNEIVRNDPYVIHTGMTGVGTTTPVINLIANPTLPATSGNWGVAKATANGANVAGSPNGYAPSNGVQGSDVELKLKRTALGLSGEKWFTPEIQVEVSFRSENKKGARMFGRAGLDSSDMQLRPDNLVTVKSPSGGWAVLLTPEPIDSNTQQLEARLNFNRDKLALTGGYYASLYVNSNGNLSPVVPGSLNRGDLWTHCATAGCSTVQQLASSSVALPPDNQAHQLYFSGNYAFSDTTRSTFKLAYTHATQNENFAGMGLTPSASAPASLGGVVDTKLAQFGLTMRPLKELSINASLRYEDRADKTPINVYNTNGIAGNALNNTTNWPSSSQTRTTAKMDGIYRLSSGYSVTLGGDWERKKAPLPPANTALFANQVLFRPVLNEYGLHTEVRKAMSEKLNGALGFEYKQRRGGDSDWVTTNGVSTVNPATSNILVAFDPAGAAGNRVLPDMYMDRNRTKLRGNIDWEANEKLSLQAVVEHTHDDYLRAFSAALLAAQPIPTVPGARTIISDSLTLDSTYLVSEDWRVNGYWTHSYNRWNVNKASLGDDTRNTTDTFGLGINGKATSRLTVGMDILTTRDTTTFNNMPSTGNIAVTAATIAATGQSQPGNFLPNINYVTEKLNFYAKYAVDKKSGVQAVLSYQHFKTDDWQWGYNGVPFLYSDNTTVSQPTNQHLIFVAARYVYKF